MISGLTILGVDVFDTEGCVAALSGYDLVLDGTSIPLNGRTTELIARARCHGVNLYGFGEEYAQAKPSGTMTPSWSRASA